MEAQLLDWLWKKHKAYTLEEVQDLVERICKFNCGAIDEYLTKHAQVVFEQWLKDCNKEV